MKLPLKSHETRETPVREVYDTTTIPELLQLIDSILEELHRSLGITSVEANQSEKNQTSTDGPDPVDSKRLSEPFFLKKIYLRTHLVIVPTELKVKIVESLPGASLAKIACICRESQCMASGNDLWKQKIWEEARHLLLVGNGGRGSVNWKAKFASFWRHYQQKLSPAVQRGRETLTDIDMAIRIHQRCRFPQIVRDPDPLGLSNGDDHLHGSVGIHRGQERLARRRFSPGGN